MPQLVVKFKFWIITKQETHLNCEPPYWVQYPFQKLDKMCQSNTTLAKTKYIMWQQGYMFWPSLSHLQALMIQCHTKQVLCTVGSPTLTISVVNEWVVMNEWVGLESYTNAQDDFLHYIPGGQPPRPWHASCLHTPSNKLPLPTQIQDSNLFSELQHCFKHRDKTEQSTDTDD